MTDVLLERDEELECLRAHVEAAGAGRGSTCVIEGIAGIGKTSLLQAARAMAVEAGVRVLFARAGPLEAGLGWNLTRQLFASVIAAPDRERQALLNGAAALAAPALGLEPGSASGSLHGLYWLASTLAQRSALLLAVDDAQWGDTPSLEYLAYLGARTEDLAVCLLVTARTDEEIPGPLAMLAAESSTEVLSLRPLSGEATATMVRRVLRADAVEDFCAACQLASGGNPFLLRELLTEIEHDRMEPTAQSAAEVARITPQTVRRTVLLRLARLPADAQSLVGALSVLGGEATLADGAELAELEIAVAVRAADALVAAGILMSSRRLAFTHPLVREVIYATLASYERSQMHGRAAGVLMRGGSDPERVATQLLASEPARDRAAVAQLSEAARLALGRGDPGAAANFLERALREPPDADQRPKLLAELGRAELTAGRASASGRLRDAAVSCAEPADRARMLLDLGRALYLSGQPRRAAEALDEGLRELAATCAEDHRALVAELQSAWLSVARTESPLRPRAAALIAELAAHPPPGQSYGERALQAQVAGELTFSGESRLQALKLARAAAGDGELIRQESADGIAWFAAAGALGWGDDFDGFDALAQAALDDARQRGSRIGFASASYNFSFTHYHRGKLTDAIADNEQAIAAEREGFRHFLPAARAQLTWALVERGELDAAIVQLDQAASDPSWEQSSMQALVREAQARVYLACGEAQRALSAALDAGRVAELARVPNPSVLAWRSRAAIAAARLGQHDRAKELLDQELLLARRFGASRAIGVTLTAIGLVGATNAVDSLEEAVQVLADSPAKLEHARALVHLGAALARQHKLKIAREMLRAGLEASSNCEAPALARHARAQLVAAGGRPRRTQLGGIPSLTPAELRVAELAAQRMGNREIAEALFVSLRTVETHLTHVYRKLDIDSRAGLVQRLDSVKLAGTEHE
jgi:DNA-binding CsgD family transcriptional regulator